MAVSAGERTTESEIFTERDLRFAEAVAYWLGLVGARAARIEKLAGDAAEQSYRAAAEEVVRELTPRQREVAALIAQGRSNAEIAEALVLTQGTVANHVEGILRRLGFKSRTQVGVWAVERGLDRAQDGTGDRARIGRQARAGRPEGGSA